MVVRPLRTLLRLLIIIGAVLMITACTDTSSLYVPDLVARAQEFNGKDVTVQGAYLERDGKTLLVLGVSTLDNGLDAQPLGDPIWVEGIPATLANELHRPGDSVYGFVKVSGRFETGGKFGPDGAYSSRIQVTAAEAIERIRRNEVRIEKRALEAGKVSLFDLAADPAKYNGQAVTSQGYYFWNGVIYVLAEGVSTEEDGSNPQPIGTIIWMEGFPPDASATLNLGPNNSFVWGKVEVSGQFQGGGQYGRNGAYTAQLLLDPANPASAKPIP
jgi:hypothetical protein